MRASRRSRRSLERTHRGRHVGRLSLALITFRIENSDSIDYDAAGRAAQLRRAHAIAMNAKAATARIAAKSAASSLK